MRRIAVLAAIALLAPAAPAGGDAAPGWRECSKLIRGEKKHVFVTRGGVTCRYARRFLQRMQREGWGRWAEPWACYDSGRSLYCSRALNGRGVGMAANMHGG